MENLEIQELSEAEIKSYNGGGLLVFAVFFALGYSIEKYKHEGHF